MIWLSSALTRLVNTSSVPLATLARVPRNMRPSRCISTTYSTPWSHTTEQSPERLRFLADAFTARIIRHLATGHTYPGHMSSTCTAVHLRGESPGHRVVHTRSVTIPPKATQLFSFLMARGSRLLDTRAGREGRAGDRVGQGWSAVGAENAHHSHQIFKTEFTWSHECLVSSCLNFGQVLGIATCDQREVSSGPRLVPAYGN